MRRIFGRAAFGFAVSAICLMIAAALFYAGVAELKRRYAVAELAAINREIARLASQPAKPRVVAPRPDPGFTIDRSEDSKD